MTTLNGNVTAEAVQRQINDANANTNENKKKFNFNEKDYLDTKLKNGETSKKLRVRILPVSEIDSRFCVEVKTHSLKVDRKIAESGFKSFICLDDDQIPNYDGNVKCPLCKKAFELFKRAKELREQGKDKIAEPLYERAKMLRNKSTYFVRVIQRGKEDEGVKFWRFNKNSKGNGVFDELINMYQNKQEAYKEMGKGDNYNIFDLNNGRDIMITITRVYDQNGNELPPSIKLDAYDMESPLSSDIEQAQKWISDNKKWYEAYTTRTPEYLNIIAEGEIPVKNSEGQWVSETQKKEETVVKNEETAAAVTESEKILEDKNESSNTDEDNDLPF